MKKHLRNLTLLGLLVSLHVQAAPVFENASTTIGDSSTITIRKPVDTQAGDLLVAALMLNKGNQIVVTTPPGWTPIRRNNRSRYIGMATYYRIADGSEPSTCLFPLDEITRWAASISRISGADVENPVAASGGKTGRKGDVIAPSVKTEKDDALVLAFYTNRRDATYAPDSSTVEQYDEPNATDDLPSNMLATFEQADAGSTGSKTASPSLSDRVWAAQQIAINAETATDLSGFNITATGSPVAGDIVSLQIANAQDAEGNPLNGSITIAIASNLDGLIFDDTMAFTGGSAALSITLTTVGGHTLVAALDGIADAESLTLTVNRRPITLTADSGQSKNQDEPDPQLTMTLTGGALLAGSPLNGQPARDPGETAGLYAIRQGSLTDANNPKYSITFISANFEIIPPVDPSGFSLITASDPVVGDTLVLQIADAQATDGSPLNGTLAATVTSSLEGTVFDHAVVFENGEATISIALSTVAAHTLTATLAGVTDPQTLTVAVNRRPITITADAGQSKMQDEPDPQLTMTLTGGALLAGIPLSGELSRDPGETAGLYAIRQGSLTDAANPTYAITFVSADFEVLPIEEPPPPPPSGAGIWISAEELATLPMSGEPWIKLKEDADFYWGVPNISDREDKANIYTLSKALVYARTGIESYRAEVIEACMQAIGTEVGGTSLALGRNLGAFIIAADLIGLPPEEDALFCSWLRELRLKPMADGRSLTKCHEVRANNWGTHAGGSRAAVAAYLEDQDELDRVAQVFKGWLGDRDSYAGFYFGDRWWQSDPDRPVGINPAGATIQGHSVDGVLPDDQRTSGGFTWPPPKAGNVYEALQGALLQAVILHRAGYDVWNWEDRALLRAWNWLHDIADYPAAGDDSWQPFIMNCFYESEFPAPEISEPGKNIARTCWTHSGSYTPPITPPPATNPPPSNPDLKYYPGDYSEEMVLGNSLPGTWRPFSADSPWNTPIPDNTATHPDSAQIMSLVTSRISNLRLVGSFLTPIWIVNTENALPAGTTPNPDRPMDLQLVHMKSTGSIYYKWDQENDKWADVPIPLAAGMYSQSAEDGQMCIIDPFLNVAYEMSVFRAWGDGYDGHQTEPPLCTTFNVWDLTGSGYGDDPTNLDADDRWWAQGGKGSGFPLIAGLIRPEELIEGEIRHALHFSFELNRRSDDDNNIMMYPPATRSDGKNFGAQYPVEGMRFQLDPSITEADFDQWGLTREGKVVARALQKYGMFLGNNGGDFKVAVQQLGSTLEENRAAWDEIVPDFYSTVRNIPSDRFRVVYTGEATIR